MNLETKLNRIENKFDIIYNAILSLEEELDVDTMRDNFNLTEDAIEALEEIDSELVDVSIGFQRFWNDWTQVNDDERIYEYSDDEEA
jgi:hypothetical protein